jgi:5'-phosphate synthase pdxT subunit
MVKMLRIGILALQGSVEEHGSMLKKIDGVVPCEVKSPEELEGISGIILPGGESTAIGKLMKDFGLAGRLCEKITAGLPVWGTCAGMILLAKEIAGEKTVHLGLMDITVRRNAYGSQLDSFIANMAIPCISGMDIPMVFIRAPWVEKVRGNAKILAEVNGKAVAVQQGNMLATSFHPELTKDLSFHKYFLKMASLHESSLQ